MNYQHIVSVCSHTGLVILLVANHPSPSAAYTPAQPQTKVIVVNEQAPLIEKVMIIEQTSTN